MKSFFMLCLLSFFFNDTATTEIYTLSLHDALPISALGAAPALVAPRRDAVHHPASRRDRKSTRLNSSHTLISYAVFCLNKQHIRWCWLPYRSEEHTSELPSQSNLVCRLLFDKK